MISSTSKGKGTAPSRTYAQFPPDLRDRKLAREYEHQNQYAPQNSEDDPDTNRRFSTSEISEIYPVAETGQQADQISVTSSSIYTLDKQQDSAEAVSQALGFATIGDTELLNIRTANQRMKSEAFDSRYKVHKSSDFKFGRIFKVIWSEPSGETGGTQLEVRGNKQIKVRRFVIINNMKGHCICLAIMSYTGRGTTKYGVRAEHHAIIYTSKNPVYLPGESGIILKPLKVKPDDWEFGILDKASRLNYAKIYTVEHNVKVWFVSRLTKSAGTQLQLDYNSIHPPIVVKDSTLSSEQTSTTTPCSSKTGTEKLSVIMSKQADSDHNRAIVFGVPTAGNLQTDISPFVREDIASDTQAYINNDDLLKNNQNFKSSLLLSRSSSAASLSTSGFSYESYPSSISSVMLSSNIWERLVEFFLDDQQVKIVLQEARNSLLPIVFQNSVRQCLKSFSEDLLSENQGPLMTRAARAIRRHRRNTAINIDRYLGIDDQHLSINSKLKSVDHNDVYDDDLDDLNDNPNDLDAEDGIFKEFEDVLLASSSFQILRDRLELLVHPNSVLRTLLDVWPISQSRTLPFKLTYTIFWNIRHYLATYFPSDQLLGEVMTLTGDILYAQAMSCRNYLKEFWPETGIFLLEVLENMLKENGKVEKLQGQVRICLTENLRVNDTEPTLTATVTASYLEQLQIMSVFSWLCAVTRFSPDIGIAISSTVVKVVIVDNQRMIKFVPSKLEKASSKATCWPQLFPHGALAQDYPIRDRKQGKGLEIEFADMVMLAGCSSFVEYRKGLVLDGLEYVVIPVDFIATEDALEWHVESKVTDGTNRRLRTSDVLTKFLDTDGLSSWHQQLEIRDLLSKRCLLAWSPNVHIAMGTARYSEIKLQHSSAEKCEHSTYVRTIGLSVSIPTPHFTPGMKIDFTPTAIVPSVKPSIGNGIHKILDQVSQGNSCNDWILMYDTGLKTGWYIPQASVVLYVAHVLLQRHGYHLEDKTGNRKSLEFAQLSSDGSITASRSLLRCIGYNVCRLDDIGGSLIQFKYLSTKSLTELAIPVVRIMHDNELTSLRSPSSVVEGFSTMVERIWNDLDTVGSCLSGLSGDFKRFKKAPPDYLHGVDIEDFWETKSAEKKMPIRWIKINQAWSHLTTHQPTVIFCKNLGHPVIDASNKLCQSWKDVPPNQSHLVMTGRALYSFLIQQEQGLGNNLEWYYRELLIDIHYRNGIMYDVIHTQELSCGRFKSMVKRITKTKGLSSLDYIKQPSSKKVSDFADGGFVFNEKEGVLCRDLTPYSTCLQLPLGVPSSTCDISDQPLAPKSKVSQVTSLVEEFAHSQESPENSVSSNMELVLILSAGPHRPSNSPKAFGELLEKPLQIASLATTKEVAACPPKLLRKKAKSSTLRSSRAKPNCEDITEKPLLPHNSSTLSYGHDQNKPSNTESGRLRLLTVSKKIGKEQIINQDMFGQESTTVEINCVSQSQI